MGSLTSCSNFIFGTCHQNFSIHTFPFNLKSTGKLDVHEGREDQTLKSACEDLKVLRLIFGHNRRFIQLNLKIKLLKHSCSNVIYSSHIHYMFSSIFPLFQHQILKAEKHSVHACLQASFDIRTAIFLNFQDLTLIDRLKNLIHFYELIFISFDFSFSQTFIKLIQFACLILCQGF